MTALRRTIGRLRPLVLVEDGLEAAAEECRRAGAVGTLVLPLDVTDRAAVEAAARGESEVILPPPYSIASARAVVAFGSACAPASAAASADACSDRCA